MTSGKRGGRRDSDSQGLMVGVGVDAHGELPRSRLAPGSLWCCDLLLCGERTCFEANIGEKVRDYGWGGARVMRNNQIWDNMLRRQQKLSKLSLSQGGCAEGRNRLSMEPWGLQHLELGGERTRCRLE